MIRRCWPLLGLQLACDDTIFGGSHEVTGAGWSAVEEIFAAECNACHGPGTAATFGNLDLETDPCGDMVGVPASEPSYGAALLVDPGNHQDSVLWAKVEDNGEYGAVMPTAGKMGQANVDIIRDWIDDGASCGGDSLDTGGVGETDETAEASQAASRSHFLEAYPSSIAQNGSEK